MRWLKIFFVLLCATISGWGVYFLHNQAQLKQASENKQHVKQIWKIGVDRHSLTNSSENSTGTLNSTIAENNQTDHQADLQEVQQEDNIFSLAFIDDLSMFIVKQYLPSKTCKNPGKLSIFSLNIKALNMRYGIYFHGINIEKQNIIQARRKIFAYSLQKKIINYIYKIYSNLLIDSIINSAQKINICIDKKNQKSRKLSSSEISELLTLFSQKLSAIGYIFQKISTNQQSFEYIQKYLQAKKNLNQAYFKCSQLKSREATDGELEQTAEQIKISILIRENLRKKILSVIRQKPDAPSPDRINASEILYLAQWVYRRQESNPKNLEQIQKLGTALQKLAKMTQERANTYPAKI